MLMKNDFTKIIKISKTQVASYSSLYDQNVPSIKIWNLSSGNCTKTIYGHKRHITCITKLCLNQIASGSDFKIKIWERIWDK